MHYGKKGMKWGVKNTVDNIKVARVNRKEAKDIRKTDKLVKKYEPGTRGKFYSDNYNAKVDKQIKKQIKKNGVPKELNKIQLKDKAKADIIAKKLIDRGMDESEANKIATTEVHVQRVKREQRTKVGMRFISDVATSIAHIQEDSAKIESRTTKYLNEGLKEHHARKLATTEVELERAQERKKAEKARQFMDSIDQVMNDDVYF
jgi:hypothetical protein